MYCLFLLGIYGNAVCLIMQLMRTLGLHRRLLLPVRQVATKKIIAGWSNQARGNPIDNAVGASTLQIKNSRKFAKIIYLGWD